MKNRYSIYKNLYGASACLLTACMVLTACDKEKEFTPAMSEAKLINSITFDVSATLPLAIGMDSTIVYSVEAPDDLEDRTIVWKSTDESIARVSQDGTITGVAEGTAVISATPPLWGNRFGKSGNCSRDYKSYQSDTHKSTGRRSDLRNGQNPV